VLELRTRHVIVTFESILGLATHQAECPEVDMLFLTTDCQWDENLETYAPAI
jgi:hypothetical protein